MALFRYQVERKIFEELLELKRMQIRAGRANEQLLVKRLSDKYSKEIQSTMGLKNHDGPYTFKEFEKYLYSKWKVFILWVTIGKFNHTSHIVIHETLPAVPQ